MANIRDEHELMRKALDGDIESRNKLIVMMRDLLYKMASKMKLKTGIDVDDLVNEAIVKIIKEFHRFDPSMNFSPLTYFGVVAWRRMQSYIDSNATMIVPDRWSIKSTTNPYAGRAMRAVDFTDIESSFGSAAGDHFNMEGDVSDHREQQPVDNSSTTETSELVRESLGCLSEDQRRVTEMLLEGHNLAYIGSRIGMTRERARQIRNAAYERIKRWVIKKKGGDPCIP